MRLHADGWSLMGVRGAMAAAGAALLVWLAAAATSAGTLERVRESGILRCGVVASGPGLAAMDGSGRWQGFFTDMCRALAAAVTGRADGIAFVELGPENRFGVLRDGGVDVVMENTGWTLQRQAAMGIAFPAIYLHDSQGLMTHRSTGIASLEAIGPQGPPATVCVVEGSNGFRALEHWIARRNLPLLLKRTRSNEGAAGAFFNHHCDLYGADRTALYALRLQAAPNAADYVILPDTIAREPLGPIVRADDRPWQEVVRWVVLATILAEEKGITAGNAARRREEGDPETRRLLGSRPGVGYDLGLDDGWGWRVVTQVGNYGEIFERHLGAGSPLRMERGQNQPWSVGGLLYAPPLGE